jgi:hypothetical protein
MKLSSSNGNTLMLGYVMTYPYERCPLSMLSRVTSIYNCDDVPKLRLYDPEVLHNAMTRIRDRERQRSGGKKSSSTAFQNYHAYYLPSIQVALPMSPRIPRLTMSKHAPSAMSVHSEIVPRHMPAKLTSNVYRQWYESQDAHSPRDALVLEREPIRIRHPIGDIRGEAEIAV